jgi:uncharacterized membrane protein YgaE (UPF0421/DUF939 family)
MPNSGDFLPPEFWYWSTIGLGFIFVTGAWYILKMYVSKLNETIDTLMKNMQQLMRNQDRMQLTDEKLEKIAEDHEHRIDELEKRKRRGP